TLLSKGSTSTARLGPRSRPLPPSCPARTGGKVLLMQSSRGSESPRASPVGWRVNCKHLPAAIPVARQEGRDRRGWFEAELRRRSTPPIRWAGWLPPWVRAAAGGPGAEGKFCACRCSAPLPLEDVVISKNEHSTEHLDVLIIGAGLSGIGAACHVQ